MLFLSWFLFVKQESQIHSVLFWLDQSVEISCSQGDLGGFDCNSWLTLCLLVTIVPVKSTLALADWTRRQGDILVDTCTKIGCCLLDCWPEDKHGPGVEGSTKETCLIRPSVSSLAVFQQFICCTAVCSHIWVTEVCQSPYQFDLCPHWIGKVILPNLWFIILDWQIISEWFAWQNRIWHPVMTPLRMSSLMSNYKRTKN